MSTASLIRKLTYSPRLYAAAQQHAEKIAGRIRSMNPDAQLVFEKTDFAINSLGRVAVIIRDVSPQATKYEFGGPHQPAWRAMSRSAEFFRE